MQSIRKFITADGTEFATATEAQAHEKALKAQAKVEGIKAKLDAQHVDLAPLQNDFDTLSMTEFLAKNATALKRALEVATHTPRKPKAE